MSSSSGQTSGLTGRYAKALYELANEKKSISKIVKDFEDLKSLIEKNVEFLNLITSPAISKHDKTASLTSILKKAKANTLTIQRQEVEKSISEVVGGKKISLLMNVDESLIGGLIVKIGSKMIDSSIKTKLNRLEIAMRGVN